MKAKDVKCGQSVLYKGEKLTVVRRISGEDTVKPIMQNGALFTGYQRTQRTFELSNGVITYAKNLILCT
jgi:hypothetical protein